MARQLVSGVRRIHLLGSLATIAEKSAPGALVLCMERCIRHDALAGEE
jgi:hypothetical protein